MPMSGINSTPHTTASQIETVGFRDDDNNPDYGDFVCSSDEDEIEMEAKPRHRYSKNLYYPTRIGEVLAERYRIEHKLSWGGFSTVWLAHDTHEKISPQNEIIQKVPDISGLVTYQDMFCLAGYGGNKHTVLVLPVRGPSLYYCMRRAIRDTVTRRVPAAKQLLLSLKSLHDAGIIHRDLNQGAVLYDMDSIENLTTAEEYKRFGRPRKVALSEVSWKQAELVEPMTFPEDRIGNNVYLCDFDMCINAGTQVTEKIQGPGMSCAPERFHDVNPSLASDMWSYMCIFGSLYVGGDPFWGEGIQLMNHVVGALGPLPAHWKGHHYLEHVDKSRWLNPNPDMDRWYDPGTTVDPKKSLEKIDRRRNYWRTSHSIS